MNVADTIIAHMERIIVAALGAAGLIGAAWVSARRGARRGAEDAVRPVNEAVQTGNGKDIGSTVRDIAQTLEIVQAQAHSNARDVIGIHERLGRLDAKLDRHEDKIDRLNGRVEQVEQNTRHLWRVEEGGEE